MATGADTAVGAILEIPPQALNAIKDAERAIKSLQATSETAARKIKGHFDNTAVSGLNTFIKKIQEAQGKLGNIKMPTIDGTGLASGISQIAQAIATVDKSATAGANRLSRIADSMAKLAASQPSAQMFQEIANGITAIGNTSQQTIANVSLLAQTMAQLARDIRTVQNAQRAQANDTASVAQYNKLYKEQADLVRQKNQLEARGNDITAQEKQQLDAIKKRYDEINDQLTKLNAKKQTAASNLARTAGEVRLTRIETPQGAMDYAKNAKSLRELQDAYKNLGIVMKSVDPKSNEWAQMNRVYQETKGRIDEIRKKMGELQNQTVNLGGIVGQLRNQILTIFSVQAISGFIKKMVEVRAQFELQNVALRAILQNKDEADRIFQQVQNMAMQSPFTIMQLTTYTKQLAAYRIESEKLVGTTKMLADVSAGLGVDMQRLILAYGQVKSANYLRACLGRGTKVKMFDGSFKNVEDIIVGDVLMGDDEQPRNVSKLYQGEQQMYRVSYLGGAFRCNEHHILTVYDALKMRVSDVFVLDYLKEPYRYHGVKRIDGEYKTFIMKVEPDNIGTYYGFSIDGNHRFIIEDNVVTHNTEVRQFTEAGLNIAGELANYFSELQGKMVSVGDVMEMITKRMVRFEDVEEVFKRVTSAGGLFYDMQKKQSESLFGQLQRIQDAYSIMMNDIGKSNQGAITSALTLIRTLIQEWRKLLPILAAVGGAFAGKAIVAVIAAVVRNLKLAITALKAIVNLQTLWNTLSKANVWGALLSVITAVVAAIWAADSATSALADELGRIRVEAADDLKESIADFHQLAKAATDATKSYTERKEALDALNRSYKDILPSYMLEEEWLNKQVGNYDAAIAKIEEYFRAKEMQKQIDTILSSKDYTDAVKKMQELGETMLSQGLFDATVTKKYTDVWMQQIAQEIASGKIEDSAEAVSHRLSEIFGKPIKVDENRWSEISQLFKNLDKEINNISLGSLAAKDNIELMQKEMEQLSPGQLKSRIEETQKEMEELGKKITEIQSRVDFGKRAGNDEALQRMDEQLLAELSERYTQLAQQVDAYGEALAGAKAKEIDADVNAQIESIQKEITTVNNLIVKRDELARTNTGTEEEKNRLAELNSELGIAKERTLNLAKSMGVDLSESELNSIDNMFDLRKLLEDVAQRAYPKLATKAVEEVAKGETAIDKLIEKVDLLKKAINSFASGLGFGKVFDTEVSDADTKAEEEEKARQAAWEKESKRNEEYIEQAAKRIGMDKKRISAVQGLVKAQDQSDSDYAKNLRAQAKSWKEQKAAIDDMTESQRKFYFEKNNLTQKAIDENAKLAEGLEDIANAYDPEATKKTKGRKGGGGSDPWIQIFKERTKALEDFYKKYDTLRDKFSVDESQRRDVASFMDYFNATGLDLNKVISKGWDTKALVENLEEQREQIKKHFGKVYDDATEIMKKGISIEAVVNPTAEQKLSHALAKLLNDLEKQIADNKIKLDFEIQEQTKEKLKKDLDDLMATYELTKEFTGMGISADMTNMFGKTPIKNLEELRLEVEKFHDTAVSAGEDGEKVYNDMLADIAKKEQKSLEERAKNYAKYIGKSYGESAKVMLDYYTKLTQMQKDFAKYEEQIKKDLANPETPQIDKDRLQGILDNLPEQAQRAASNMRTEMEKELAKINLEKVFKSPLFSEMFQTLGHLSNATLDRMLAQIRQIRDASENLNLSQLRRLSQAEEKIMAAKIDNGSLKDAVKYIKEAYELRSKGITLQKANDDFAVSQEELTRLEQLKDDVGFVLGLKEKSYAIDIDSKSLEIAGERQALSDQQVKLLTDQKYLQESINATTDDAMSKQLKLVEGSKQNVDAYKNAEDATKKLEKELNAAAEVGKEAGELLKSSFDLFGANISEADQEWVDFASNMLSTIVTLGIAFVALSVTINSAAGILGIIAMALSAITGLFSALFRAHDKRLEKQIRDKEKQVENLERAFDKLQKAIDNAFSFKGVVENTDKAIKNKQAQISKQYEIIRLNDEKKKRDQDAIDEARKKIEDLQDEMAELEKQKYEVFGGFGTEENIRSAAQEFADVWADGFMETGDGLDALKDKFDEFALNMLKKQVWGRLADNLITPILTSFDQAFDKDGNMDPEKWANLVNNLKEINLDAFNEQAKQLADALGFKGGKGELILSDLQKGIQNITEPQAAALEAYMNSIRFEVFHHSEQLERLIAAVSMQYGTGENPMVTELKGIRTVLDNIHSTIRGLIETRVGRGDCLRIV